MPDPSLPPPDLLARQAAWLAPARSRLLRRVHVARRRRVLDLGCGSGAITAELVRRAGPTVVALDRHRAALSAEAGLFAGAHRVAADARALPLADAAFDLVFSQFVLLWLDAPQALAEIARVLQPDGVLVALEPDYGGLIEHPPEIAARELWLAALRRAGADPTIGRKLPGLLAAAGFDCHVELLDRLEPPDPTRFELLRDLPLTDDERERLARLEQADRRIAAADRVAHLPVSLIVARRTIV